MINKIIKVMSLVIATAYMASITPAMATDVKKYSADEGTIYAAKAKVGWYVIDAELNGEDEAFYVVKDGKYTKLQDAVPGDTIVDIYDDKYLGLEGSKGVYYIDITTGKETDEYDKDIKDKENGIKLRNEIKDDNDGSATRCNMKSIA